MKNCFVRLRIFSDFEFRVSNFLPLFFILVGLSACNYDQTEIEEMHELRGRYVAPAFDGEAAIIEHEAIPGGMDAMRMSMRVADPEAWSNLQPGKAIVFELIATEDEVYVQNPSVLPDTTTLFIPSEMPSEMEPPAVESAPADSSGT